MVAMELQAAIAAQDYRKRLVRPVPPSQVLALRAFGFVLLADPESGTDDNVELLQDMHDITPLRDP